MNWQRTNIQAAAAYLRERIAAGASDPRTRAVYEGLLDVLEPNRRALRQQREMHELAKATVPVHATRERRATVDRRSHRERRVADLGPPGGMERRRGAERRAGADRRRSGR